MASEFLERLRINQSGKVVDKKQAAIHAANSKPADEKISIDLGGELEKQLTATEKYEIEDTPRETLLKMLVQRKLDEHFVFKTALGQGENYVQAIRQILSRTRKKAAKKKQRLDEFKLLTISITHESDHDVVTLMRTKQMSAHEESVYDELIDAFAKK